MRKIFYFSFIILLFLSMHLFAQTPRLSTQLGDYKSHQITDNELSIAAENAMLKIYLYQDDIIRIRAVKNAFKNDHSFAVIQKPMGKFKEFTETAEMLTLKTQKLIIQIKKKPIRISFLNNSGIELNSDDADFGITWQGNEVTCYKKLFKDEKFIGLGEKTGPLNRRSMSYENWNSDVPAYSLDKDPLYATIPFYMGIHQNSVYGLFFDNSFKSNFVFGASTDETMMSFGAVDGEMNYYFMGSGSVSEVIKSYTWLCGRAQLPPKWSLGFQQCRWSYYPDKEVLNLAKTFREKKFPCDVIYLDIHHMNNYKVFTFHPEYFPEPAELINELKQMGFHVVVIVDPGLKVEEGYTAYDQGVKNNYFIKYPNGKEYTGDVWPGRSHFTDYTNPKAREWWGTLFDAYTKNGVEGFWNDMNEPAVWGQKIPDLLEMDFEGNKSTIREGHNIFGMQMSRGTFDGTKKLMNNKRPLVITRATYAGGQRFSTIWTGDNAANDDHMLLGVRLVNSLGISGFPFAGPDVGGFIGEPSSELLTRWYTLGAFTPFYRCHSAYGERYREPWTLNKDLQDIVRKYINLRYEMLPYLYSTAFQSTQTGMPMSRTLAIQYPFDEKIYQNDFQNQFMFGDYFLVAPAKSTQDVLKIYLPEGSWYRYSSDEKFSGNYTDYFPSPLNDLPVFVKEGAIIPMQNTVQYSQEENDGWLYVHVYNGGSKTSFSMYEDDGISYDFEKSVSCTRNIEFDAIKKSISFSKQEGKFVSKFKNLKIILHGFEKIAKVKLGSIEIVPANLENKQIIETEYKNEAFSMILFKE